MSGVVIAVSRSATHSMAKPAATAIRLLAGVGVEGDAHRGVTVKHRSHAARDPTKPNLRQVHLIHGELHDELREQGLTLSPGEMGENITTSGVDLLGLPGGSLRPGSPADVVVFDPDAPWVLDRAELKSKCKNTPFDEARFTGRVVRTIIGGRTVYEHV